MEYTIELSIAAERHLDQLSAHDRRIVLAAVFDQLTHQPLIRTRNRKELRPNPLANWELRVGKYRVLYNVVKEESVVAINAVAVKDGNKLVIEGEVHEL